LPTTRPHNRHPPFIVVIVQPSSLRVFLRAHFLMSLDLDAFTTLSRFTNNVTLLQDFSLAPLASNGINR
ncbi:unnamed protein product, partial [Amoebophrya sp. A25]